MGERTFLTFVRDSVTIHRPMASSYVRGVTSPLSNAPTFSLRMHDDVIQTVDEAAALLEMSRSDFIRWCARYVALDIIEQKKEFDKLSGKMTS